jgi:hypothetical protein
VHRKPNTSVLDAREVRAGAVPPDHKVVDGNITLLPPVESCPSLKITACPATGFEKAKVVVAADKV